MKRSHRAWLAIAAVLIAAALVVSAWQAWPQLLLFGGIVAVAAWGFGRQTRVKSREKVSVAAVAEEAPAPEQERPV